MILRSRCGLDVNMDKMKGIVILPRFYDYSDAIIDELSKTFDIDMYYEEPVRILFLLCRKIQNVIKKNWFFDLFNRIIYLRLKRKNCHYDFLFVIRGNIINPKLIVRIKQDFLKSGASSVYYTWDSFCNLPNAVALAKVFNRKYSFDLVDVKNYPEFQHLPLFYTKDFHLDNSQSTSMKYDLVCIASFNVFRYKYLVDLRRNNSNLRIFIKLYIDKELYLIKKLTDKFFSTVDTDDLVFHPLPKSEIIMNYQQGIAILDITHENQNGLSMRTIEAIGIGKKLVTNNCDVKGYDFYSSNNVFLLDSAVSPHLNEDWFRLPYKYSDETRQRYSIDNWARVITTGVV